MKQNKYTLWTNPMENWTQAFAGVTHTAAVERAVEKELKKVTSEKIKKRTEAFRTPLTSGTLSKTIE
jgi:hypothetical protein